MTLSFFNYFTGIPRCFVFDRLCNAMYTNYLFTLGSKPVAIISRRSRAWSIFSPCVKNYFLLDFSRWTNWVNKRKQRLYTTYLNEILSNVLSYAFGFTLNWSIHFSKNQFSFPTSGSVCLLINDWCNIGSHSRWQKISGTVQYLKSKVKVRFPPLPTCSSTNLTVFTLLDVSETTEGSRK